MQVDNFKLTGKNQEVSNERGAIRKLVGTIKLEDWTFPAHAAGDGCMGRLCVSQFDKVQVPVIWKPLAMHVTFEIPNLFIPSTQGLKRGDPVKVTVKNLHLTIRPVQTQMTISDYDAPSILTARLSAHRGINNPWNYKKWNEQRLKELATALDMDENTRDTIIAALNQVLRNYQAEPLDYLAKVGSAIIAAIQTQIKANLTKLGVGGGIQVQVTQENWANPDDE